MKEIYKGFLICEKRYYIELSEIDDLENYNFVGGVLIDNTRESNKKNFKMKEYYSNKTIFDAIDIYDQYKDKDVLKLPSSYIFDAWFGNLKKDAITFKKTFGLEKIDRRFMNSQDSFDYWTGLISKDKNLSKIITDEIIKSFFNIQVENDKIINSKAKRLDNLVW